MARFYPPRPRTGATRGERLVLDGLRALSDAWCVLHSLDFAVAERGGLRFGEADFVLLHPRFGLLVVEVKDGEYAVDGRQWVALRADGVQPVRDPFEQAAANRFRLMAWLKEQAGVRWLPAAHCVLFTDGRPSGRLGPNAPEELVLDRASLHRVRSVLGTVFEHFRLAGWAHPDDFGRVLAALSPAATVERTVGYDVDLTTGEIEALTRRQIEFTTEQLEVLEATSNQRRSLVLGAAGTGKTLLAQTRSRELARDGGAVGLIGQPRHLRRQLRESLQASGVCCGDAADVLADAFGAEAFAGRRDDELWITAVELAEAHGRPFDHLIVDEAQSQNPYLLGALEDLVRPGGTTLLFADPYQRDATGMWRPEGDYNTFWLTRNCRNALPIAKLVARISGAPSPRSGPDGRRPRLSSFEPGGHHEVVRVVRELLQDLRPAQLAVLTRSAHGHEPLRRALLRAGVPRAVHVGSVEEFRGCEAQVVVYAADASVSTDRTLDYIAASRACAYLHIVGDAGQWDGIRFLMEEHT
ncbi:NERD domain-containing protein [Dactylosporangium vinaceum]|uniref:NERD domain-containing protein n=1 Tax=Dactylosporangium vinaceum TaxID=53362 RepID=A0ABV5M755_9ACTN|nr:NERD domain-containing protein [Dactylosporangium vinaceum]UAC00600.1 NERD domain-containing protein [Dactylosporangium vinaceum]